MKVFRIQADDERDFFTKILLVLSGVVNIKPSARVVLAEILYWNHKYRKLPKEAKDEVLLSFESKQKMIEHLKMSSANLHNQIHYLRKRGIIKNNSLNDVYNLKIDDVGDILFSIEIKK